MYDSVYSVFNDEDGLNARERDFCHTYLLNGCDLSKVYNSERAGERGLSKKCCYKLLEKPHVRAYIKKRIQTLEEQVQVKFNQKYLKLWHIANVCFPDWADAEDLKKFRPESSINAIKEMNKMAGDYVEPKKPEDDKEDEEVIAEVLGILKKKYKREY